MKVISETAISYKATEEIVIGSFITIYVHTHLNLF